MATAVALSSFAEKKGVTYKTIARQHTAAKTTAVGDTVLLDNTSTTDTFVSYSLANPDSGFVFGTNALGDKGFAERYFSTNDVQVIGVLTQFTGHVNPASTKDVVFNVWNVGARTSTGVSGHLFHSGYPGTSIANRTASVTSLGITTTGTGNDTAKVFAFSPASPATHLFFIGYTVAYDPTNFGGDTLGLISTIDGERNLTTQPIYNVVGADTIINDLNTTMFADGTWHNNATSHFTIWNNLAIFPIVIIGQPSEVSGVTKNNFTLFGNYPNPANNETNIKFAVANNTEVTVVVYDIAGRVINTIKQNCNAGTQTMALNTSALASGEYMYLVRTAEGEGIASKFTVAK